MPSIHYGVALPTDGSPTPHQSVQPRAEHLRAALLCVRARRMRDATFSKGLFADPAWDILLDLFIARCRQRAVTISDACIAAAVPATTALRQLYTLEKNALIVRNADPTDRRRTFVSLSDLGDQLMTGWFELLPVWWTPR